MIIVQGSLTLRFYVRSGWTEGKVRKLLVNPEYKIELTKGNTSVFDYYICYDNTIHKIFKESEMKKHNVMENSNCGNINWYIKKGT